MSLSELQGKTTMFVFAFTNCADICPLSLADFKRVKKALGAESDKVNFLMMSVDGARDTPEVMKRYLGWFGFSNEGGRGFFRRDIRSAKTKPRNRKLFGFAFGLFVCPRCLRAMA
jgi:cytochrome oxidase Cu insertion factor (SCO1/SenC/PrrC family)